MLCMFLAINFLIVSICDPARVAKHRAYVDIKFDFQLTGIYNFKSNHSNTYTIHRDFHEPYVAYTDLQQ